MHVGKKIFPYPIINQNFVFSTYDNKEFSLDFEQEDSKTHLKLMNIHFKTNSDVILDLYNKEIVEIGVIIECSDTMYRKYHKITNLLGQHIIIKNDELSEKVTISCFCTMKEDFVLNSNEEFIEDYKGVNFELEKYCILGVDDGFTVQVVHESTENNIVKSIFSIVSSENVDKGLFNIECQSRKISISLTPDDYKVYHGIFKIPAYKEIFFGLFLIPSLIDGLEKCRELLKKNNDIEDVENEYNWFRSVTKSYILQTGVELTSDIFEQTSSAKIAQIVLNKPISNALTAVKNTIKEGILNDNEYN